MPKPSYFWPDYTGNYALAAHHFPMPVSGLPTFLIGLVIIIRTYHFLDSAPEMEQKICEN